MWQAVLIPDDRERLTPVALAREQPVTQAVGDGSTAEALGFQPFDHRSLGFLLCQAVQTDLVIRRINSNAVAGVRRLGQIVAVRIISCADSANNVELVLVREFPVTIVMRGNSHDRAGAVAPEDVVGDEHGHLVAVDGVNAVQAGEDAGLRAFFVGAFGFRLACSLGTIAGNRLARGSCAIRPCVLRAFRPRGRNRECSFVIVVAGNRATKNRVFGRNNHEGGAKQSIGASRIDLEVVDACADFACSGNVKADRRTFGATDPVALHRTDLVGPVDCVKVVCQTLAVSGNAHHPLAQIALEHRVVAPLGATFGSDLFVRENGTQARTPVHGSLGHIHQTEVVDDLRLFDGVKVCPIAAVRNCNLAVGKLLFELSDRTRGTDGAIGSGCFRVEPGVEDLQEDPLGPVHVLGVGRGQRTATIVGQAKTTKLATHIRDVFLGRNARVLTGLHGVLFCRQAEGVVAHCVEDVFALHTAETSNRVGGDVAQRVTNMQTLA